MVFYRLQEDLWGDLYHVRLETPDSNDQSAFYSTACIRQNRMIEQHLRAWRRTENHICIPDLIPRYSIIFVVRGRDHPELHGLPAFAELDGFIGFKEAYVKFPGFFTVAVVNDVYSLDR